MNQLLILLIRSIENLPPNKINQSENDFNFYKKKLLINERKINNEIFIPQLFINFPFLDTMKLKYLVKNVLPNCVKIVGVYYRTK